MTQAAVSYQIRLLEERLGVPLFARVKGRVSLTDAGRRIAPLVASAFETLDDAFSGLVAEDQALLSISTAQTFATTWLAPRLGAFQMRHPDLAVRLSSDNRLVDFSTGEYHAAVRVGRGDWPGLKCHFLFRLNFSPICSADFAAAPQARAAGATARRAAAQPGRRLVARSGCATWASATRERRRPIPAWCSTIR